MADQVTQAINQITLMAVTLKLAAAITKKATDLGIPEEEFNEKVFQPAMDAFGKSIPQTMAEQLASFKKAVGPAMWKDLKDSPTFPTLLEAHVAEVKLAKRVEFTKLLSEILGGGLTEEDVAVFITLSMASKGLT